MTAAGGGAETARSWIDAWWAAGDPAARLISYLGRLEGAATPPGGASGRSPAEVRIRISNILARRDSTPGTRVAVRLAADLVEEGGKLRLAGPDALLEGDLADPIAGLHEIDRGSAPALILAREAPWNPAALEAAGKALAAIAEAVPAAALAWALPEEALGILLRETSESRWKALCREGVVRIPGLGLREIEDRLAGSGLAGTALAGSARCLAADGADPDLASAYVEAARAVPAAADPEGAARARSAAEAFLWLRLETLPETAGLFELNRRVDLGAGRPLEIDLFAEDPRIAIEIDGPFHFAGRESYRADRRRDYLLQRAGCLVLRFLPEDVVECLEAILATIREAVAGRR